MKIGTKCVDIEISDLDLNTLTDRTTIDKGYLKYIDLLDQKLGAQIPIKQKILVVFYHSYQKVSSIRKKFEPMLLNFIKNNDLVFEQKVNNVAFKIEKLELTENSKRKITGCATTYG